MIRVTACLLFALGLAAAEDPVAIERCAVAGAIRGGNIAVTLELALDVRRAGAEIDLAVGALALLDHEPLPPGCALRLARERSALVARFDRRGPQTLGLTLGVRPRSDGEWREVRFDVPSSLVRELRLTADRDDLEIAFPGALRQRQELVDGRLVATALQGPGEAFAVRWKPQVGELDAELVYAARSSVVAALEPGALTLDQVVDYELAQGELETLRLTVPEALQITAVRGEHIRDWQLVEHAAGRELVIALNRARRGTYRLLVSAQRRLDDLPTAVAVPALQPQGAMRHSGQILLGTDSAVRLVVGSHSGCTQIDAGAVDLGALRSVAATEPPTLKRFAYQFAAGPFAIGLELDRIVPALDVQQRLRLQVREEDVVLAAQLDLEVRDAPVAAIELSLPAGFVLAAASGEALEPDAAVSVERDGGRFATIPFATPFQGRTLIELRLERAQGVLGSQLALRAPAVAGARVQRGHLVLDAEPAVVLDAPTVDGLRQVHTAAVPVAGGGRFAYRFRDADWSLRLAARRRPAGVRAELLHLHTLDDGVAHGTVIVNYVITGAPVDRLRFHLPPGLQGVEFVGADVVRSEREGEIWTVGLRRRVSGDYNLAIAFTQPLGEEPLLRIGGISSLDAESESGFVVVAAQRDLRLELPESSPALLRIEAAELPPHYRLLVPAPVLASWSFAAPPPLLTVRVEDRAGGAPLAALVELAEAETELAVTADERVESRTVVRYQVKNAAAQFLPLSLPPGTGAPRVWLVDAAGERRAATVSRSDDGRLLVQLPRLANPNQPIGLELVYGAAHGAVGDRLALAAPEAGLATTFTRWRIRGPADWAMLPREGGTALSEGAAPGARSLLGALAQAWWYGLRALPWLATLLVAVAALAAAAALRRGWIRSLLAIVVALGLLVVAGLALGDPALGAVLAARDADGDLVVTDALRLDGGAPAVVLDLRPRWLAGLDPALLVSGLVLLAALAWRRLRRLRAALALGGILALTLALPPLWPFAVHLATWAAVVVLAGAAWWHRLRLRAGGGVRVRGAVTALLLVSGLALGGCGGGTARAAPGGDLGAVAVELRAEDDAMAVVLSVTGPIPAGDHRWLPPGAVVDAVESLPPGVTVVVVGDGRQVLRLTRPLARLDLRFLSPLPPADAEARRGFELALPVALRTRARLEIPSPGQRIVAPGAVQLVEGEDAAASWAEAALAPGETLRLAWWPRARALEREESLVYAELRSLYRADRGVVGGRHLIDYRIAQGELRELVLELPAATTVTGVAGAHVGAWRFDPDGRLLVRLSQPARERYRLELSTQTPVAGLPGEVALAAPLAAGVVSQRGVAGLAASRAVRIELLAHPPSAGVEDVLREGAGLFQALGLDPERLRHAFRVDPDGGAIHARLHAVEPELRAEERATVRIGEERLVYSSELAIEVRKAGIFALELAIAGEVDVDLLAAPQVSHWDERRDAAGRRQVTVHLRAETSGRIPLQVALSRPLGPDDGALVVPAVRLLGARRQHGGLAVVPERGLQLRVAAREALSERHPRELGMDEEGALAFDILGGDWRLELGLERTRPLVRVEALHLARVAAASVRHELALRYHLEHAGIRRLALELPPGAFGLAVEGPEIARWDRREDRLEIELTRKWFDRTWPLTLRFETRLGAGGAVRIAPVRTPDATIRRDHLAVFATDRVELAVSARDEALLPADARAVPAEFAAGDLAAAAFCYRVAGRDYALELRAERHEPAALQQAEVRRARVASVITARGDRLSRLQLDLVVGARRHLRLALPPGSELWELNLGGRAVDAGRDADGALLVPIAHTAGGELALELLATWITPGDGLAGRTELVGPLLDLPLRDVEWTVVVPRGWRCDDFGGTLHHLPEGVAELDYDLGTYLSKVAAEEQRAIGKATANIEAGDELAARGEQYAARQALAEAFNWSNVDAALNEDARIQLYTLSREQALACLVGRRGSLHRGVGGGADLGDRFNRADVRRLAAGLTKDDSDNLDRITARIAELSATVGTPPRITVGLPEQGTLLRFSAPLQVDPGIPMRVAFDAEREPPEARRSALPGFLVLLAALLLASVLPLALGRLLPAGADPVDAPQDDGADLLAELESAVGADVASGGDEPAEAEQDPGDPEDGTRT